MSRFVFPQDGPRTPVYLEVNGNVWGVGPWLQEGPNALFKALRDEGRESKSDWTIRPFTSIPTSLFTNKEEIK